jgi:hypothetical protein
VFDQLNNVYRPVIGRQNKSPAGRIVWQGESDEIEVMRVKGESGGESEEMRVKR